MDFWNQAWIEYTYLGMFRPFKGMSPVRQVFVCVKTYVFIGEIDSHGYSGISYEMS